MARKINKSKNRRKPLEQILKNKVQHILRTALKPMSYRSITSKLEVKDFMGKQKVMICLEELVSKGTLKKVENGKFVMTSQMADEVIGLVDVTQGGRIFVTVEGMSNDIIITSPNRYNVITGDTVKVALYKQKKNARLEGKIITVINRCKTQFVGTLQLSKKHAFAVLDCKNINFDVFVPLQKIKNAQDREKVLIEITDWGQDTKNPFGKVIKVLGKIGEHHTEIHSILAEYNLPYEFSAEVENEANNIVDTIDEKEIKKRRDMREVLTFTIDPVDAKDFDDALSVQQLENGNWEIGVHIADVSHYVQPNTALNKEAFDRSTSVYLVDRVVPMLPEILSNKVCSLRPNEEKFTFSAVFEMDKHANLISQWFGRTVTLSDKRFTYEQAQEVIENKEGELSTEILLLDKLAKILRKRRIKKGAVSFERSEVKFNLDEKNNPTSVYFKDAKDSNQLIEEFMLLTNKKVSEFISLKEGKPSNKTFVYRIHDQPDAKKINTLSRVIKQFGYKHIKTDSQKAIASSMNELLYDVKGKSEANMVENLAMRCMSKAEYSTNNIGHYGLAFQYYSHFTSPIRRYPDVMVHRLLQHYLDEGKSVDKIDYENQCKHCSQREQLATNAERDSIKYMQVKFMKDKIGDQFKGVITGVTQWGVYVEIIENFCEGMIRIRDIKSDFYQYDEDKFCIIGQQMKNIYRLGDQVIIKVKNVDLYNKNLDFELVEKV